MSKIILDQDDVDKIKVLYKEGFTQKKLAKMFKVGIKTIRKVLNDTYVLIDVRGTLIGKDAKVG